MRTAVMTLALLVLVAAPAKAEPGTFFIVEGGIGFSAADAFPEGPSGMLGTVTLGAGGKPKGMPLRFYGILNLGWAALETDQTSATERAVVRRDTFAWSAGLRIYVPIASRLRFFADVTFGGFAVETEALLGGGTERLTSDDGSFLVSFAAGIQWRFTRWFSLGARIESLIPTGLDSFDPIAEAAGAASADAGIANYGFSLTATIHL